MDVGWATFPFFITSQAACCVTVILTQTVMVTSTSTLSVSHCSLRGSSIVYVCFDTTDSVSVLSYLTEKRGDSVRGLLLDLESETDMRSTHGNINVAKRRCALTKRLKLILKSGVFSHLKYFNCFYALWRFILWTHLRIILVFVACFSRQIR